ncbi:MAG: hypothetical protein RB191_04985 [Terriglobia bacterium]|jgi:hypothetical protein|nr:hypothetical protein [Terriglobia bacterium]
MPQSIEKQIKATYFSLRVTLAVIAFVFPFLLWFGARVSRGIHLRDSMSAYYWAAPGQMCSCGEDATGHCLKKKEVKTALVENSTTATSLNAGTMRNYFVGLMFAIGFILYVYKGYTNRENIALNFAGVMAVCVALFPMPWDCERHPVTVHGACAILFFLAIAYVSAFCADATLVLLVGEEELQQRFRRIYRWLAIFMLISPLLAYGFSWITEQNDSFIYWAEVFGIYAFATYWVVKIKEISMIHSRQRAIKATRGMLPRGKEAADDAATESPLLVL